MRLSLHDPKGLGKNYIDDPDLWKQTESEVRQALIVCYIAHEELTGEAAFYGPKVDVQVWSAIGREFTLATNQVDFAVPAKFDLTYISQSIGSGLIPDSGSKAAKYYLNLYDAHPTSLASSQSLYACLLYTSPSPRD